MVNNMIYKVGDKIKVIKGCSMQSQVDKNRGTNGRIIGDYDHFYLVQHKNFKECYSKASLVCKDAILKIVK